MGSGASKDGAGGGKNSFLIETLEDHDAGINCLTLSDDGSLLISGSEDNSARMWSTSTETCECLGVLQGHTDYISSCAIADAYAFTGSADGTIRKWDLASSACLYEYKGHSSRVNKVIAGTSEFIFSSSADHTAKAWLFDMGEIDMDETKACIRTFEGHTKGVFSMVFIPAKGIASDIIDNQLNINPCDRVITGSADCTARTWSFETGKCLKIFAGHKMPITCLGVDEAGETLFTGAGDATIRSWDIAKGEGIQEFTGHVASIICMQIVDKMVYSGSSDQTARGWVAEFGDCTRVFTHHKHSVTAIKFYDGILLTGCGDSHARAFDGKSGTLKRTFQGHEGVITAIEVAGNKMYTSSVDGTIRIWEIGDLFKETSENVEENKNE